ncbi:MAG: class I SAM-dependent methyltransferase [Bacteroidales bacterium]|nr:class I SAM-dependent methyltransferase [Bacteroidales bacterium]
MTWEETIQYIRTKQEFAELIRLSYLDENLPSNVELYRQSDEFKEVLHIFRQFVPQSKTLLDVGCGNGTSSIAFALEGYDVTALEPDSSETVGTGAIQKLAAYYQIPRIAIQCTALENANLDEESFDIVFVRQAMHHAYHLNTFVEKAARLLKKGGLLLTIRDHVVFSKKDKQWFLNSHPLQKFYGGENAYTPSEYRKAIKKAGLSLIREIKHFDSVINYFPAEDPAEKFRSWKKQKKAQWGPIIANNIFLRTYAFLKGIYPPCERKVAGRLHSYIAIKT